MSRVTWCAVCLSVALGLAAVGCERSNEDPPRAPSTETTAAKPAPAVEEKVEPVTGPLKQGTQAQQNALAKAKVFYLKGELEDAEVLFEALTRSLPISSEVVSAGIALGDIYSKQGRGDEAIELYDYVLERAPNVPEVHLVVGRAHASASRRELAIESYRKALEIQPSYLFLWVELGQLHAARGEQEESAKAFVRYEQEIARLSKILKGGDEEAIEDRIEIVDIFSFVEDERAIQALTHALNTDPEESVRARAAHALADSYAVSARADLERARAKDPSSAVRGAAVAALRDLEGLEEPDQDEEAPEVDGAAVEGLAKDPAKAPTKAATKDPAK